MRIALVTPYDYPYPGGVTEHISSLDRIFRRWGHEVWVLAASTRDADELDHNVIKVGGGVVGLPTSGSVARISLSPRIYRRVKTILREKQFDVIHLHEPMMPVLPLVVLRHSHTVNVGTFHAFRENGNPAYEYGRHLLQPFFDRLDAKVAVSEAARDAVARYFPGEYTIVPNGIDYERFADGSAPLPVYADRRPTILFLGRLEKRKGFQFLLEAFAQVRMLVPDARLLVAGAYTKEDKEPFVVQARRNGIRGVHFIGYVPEELKPRLFHSCDVCCVPSTGFESFGIVLLEAMAAGRPLVASNIPGYRCVMTDGREGLFVEPGDPQGLAAALIRLLRDPELRSRMGAQGKETARRFDWEKVAGQLLSLYQALLEERGVHLHDQ